MGRFKTRLLMTLAIMGVMFTGFGISSISFDGKKAKDFLQQRRLISLRKMQNLKVS